MLHEFIARNRALLIERTRERVARRTTPLPTEFEIRYGVPLFLDQVQTRLMAGMDRNTLEIGAGALRHGGELLEEGLSIGQVVHDYGNVCQAITDLAVEVRAPITTEEFRTLNLCLDVAIAEAVTEYARRREASIAERNVEQLGFLAHELRNFLNSATLALEVVRSGSVGIMGSTGDVLVRSLHGMRALVDHSLASVRLEAGPPHAERIMVAQLFQEIEIAAVMDAKAHHVILAIEPADPGMAVAGDAQILASILTNLVQNACKFTHADGHVALRAYPVNERVRIDVADECGGLPPGIAEALFAPYVQAGTDRSGLGLGLAISRRGAQAIGGDISVLDRPGMGCVFTLDLERAATA